MVTFTSPDDVPGSYHSYYRTRRTPFIALQDQEVSRYISEVNPVYSDHDARIRGAQSGGQMAFEQARAQSSTVNALVEGSASSRRELQGSTDQGLVRRSPTSQREAEASIGKAQGTTYVLEEHIPAQLYYTTRRAPIVGLHNSDVVGYNREVGPVYSDHDIRIRGAQSDGQSYTDNALVERSSSRRRELQSSNDKAVSRRCSSCQREAQSPTGHALVKRSSSCSREVQTSGTQRADVQEYIKNGSHTKEYVYEEHIPPQYNYRVPLKSELMALEYDRRAQSVLPKQESPTQLIKILAEPGLLYYAPLRPDEPKPWPELEHPTYYDNRRAVFTEPRGSELKHYTFRIMPSEWLNAKQLMSSSYGNTLDRRRRSRSHSREHAMKQQVIYEDVSSDIMKNSMSTARNVNNEMALVPFDRSQSVPPAQQEYSSQWIKIPGGPATIAVYPTISSNDPSTWTNQVPLRIDTYDTRKAVDSRSSNDNAVVKSSSQSKKQSAQEIVTYEHFPKQDMSLKKREIATDQRFDRSHINNRGSEYRSKWVSFRSGPSPFVYSSIHSRDKEACSNPAITGYVGSTNYLESRERSKRKDEKEYSHTKESSIDKNYMAKSASSKVNRILNTKEDFDKKHVLDMLFNIQHIIKEREALGAYDIPFKLRNKMSYLTNIVQDISLKNKSHHGIGSYPTESVKSFLAVSSLLAPIRPDHGRTNATTRFQYMLHEPRVF